MNARTALILMLIILFAGRPLVDVMLYTVTLIGDTMKAELGKPPIRVKEPPGWAKNTTYNTIVNQTLDKGYSLISWLLTLISNPYTVAVLIAAGMFVTVLESHLAASRQTPPL